MKSISHLKLTVFLILSSFFNFAQTITTTNTLTPAQLVNQVLLGSGVTASNIKYNGSTATANAVQQNALRFNATGFPFTGGIYLRTQNGATTGVSNDPDLNAIATNTVTNGGILEFDFVATGDTLSFKYMFASAEYPDFVCSEYNDVFGFFISGPGINGPFSNNAQNIALIPNSTIPVAINTVNSGTSGAFGSSSDCAAQDPNWQSNSIYYTSQYATYSGQGYNGGTISLAANSDLVCGATYHIKMAISNVGDQLLNSGVYLQAGSFTTLPVEFAFNTYAVNNTVYEGCNQLGTLMFTRQGCGNENDTLIAYTSFSGSATNGVDYTQLGDSVFFAPGVDTIYWQILPFEDNIAEGTENILITITSVLNNGDVVTSQGTFYISDVPTISITGSDRNYVCFRDSTNLTTAITNGFPPFQYQWSTNETTAGITVPINGNGVTGYEVSIIDACGYTASDSVFVRMNQTLAIDSIVMITPATCLPEGSITSLTYPYGGTQGVPGNANSYSFFFDWTYRGDTNIVWPHQSSLQDLPGGWYVLELTDNIINCTVTDSVFVETINTPSAQGSASPSTGCSPVEAVFSNNSQNATNYTWDFGNGNVINTSSTSNLSETYTSDAVIMLVASNGFTPCNDTTYLNVQIITCGCMNPDALNYNPNAVASDGSCIFPTPTVTAPNVLTLNGDDINSLFFLKTTNAERIELTIINRWGNVVYEGNGNQLIPPMWNGTDKSGKLVEDGVYFFKYKVTGLIGDPIEGHDFVTVVR